MTVVEKTGKTVEAAVADALKELKITADQAEIEVLEEAKKGFLIFGRKDARVRVSVKEEVKNDAAAASAPKKTLSEAEEHDDNAV